MQTRASYLIGCYASAGSTTRNNSSSKRPPRLVWNEMPSTKQFESNSGKCSVFCFGDPKLWLQHAALGAERGRVYCDLLLETDLLPTLQSETPDGKCVCGSVFLRVSVIRFELLSPDILACSVFTSSHARTWELSLPVGCCIISPLRLKRMASDDICQRHTERFHGRACVCADMSYKHDARDNQTLNMISTNDMCLFLLFFHRYCFFFWQALSQPIISRNPLLQIEVGEYCVIRCSRLECRIVSSDIVLSGLCLLWHATHGPLPLKIRTLTLNPFHETKFIHSELGLLFALLKPRVNNSIYIQQ